MELTYTERNGVMYPDLALPRADQFPHRQVRQNAPRLSQKAPQRYLYHASHHVHTQSAPIRNRAGGKAADRPLPLPLGKRARHHRRTQSHRSSQMGAGNEQCKAFCRGTRVE